MNRWPECERYFYQASIDDYDLMVLDVSLRLRNGVDVCRSCEQAFRIACPDADPARCRRLAPSSDYFLVGDSPGDRPEPGLATQIHAKECWVTWAPCYGLRRGALPAVLPGISP